MDEIVPDLLEFMSSFSEKDWNVSSRWISEIENDVEIIQELKTNLDKHRCDLCCQGDFLVNKLLRFSGILNNEYKYACETCDKSFKMKSGLTKHLSEHTVINFERSQNNRSAPIHIRENISSQTEEMSCKFCDKRFKSIKQLQQHYEYKHGAITRTCAVCKIVFFNFKQFSQHCFSHTRMERKENVCPKCGKCFLWKKTLKLHLSTHS